MDRALRQLVRDRAGNRCEYCHLHQDQDPFYTFHVEHILARQHAGPTSGHNLALACHHCNRHKGTNLSAPDPDTGAIVRLFNPRTDQWADHFTQSGPRIIGQTSLGRATARLLKMNNPDRLKLR